jgi:hypothetical protein
MSKLKPCPFCGSDQVEPRHEAGGWFIRCTCGIEVDTCCGKMDSAVEVWNDRPAVDAALERVAEWEALRKWLSSRPRYNERAVSGAFAVVLDKMRELEKAE